jgi:dinuclear metal center YbgI/SA1388 family protein
MIIEPSCSRNDLLHLCHQLLEPWRFKDYCPNGLQVEGIEAISRVALAVTANQAAIDAAIDWNAQALITHHGLMWKGEDGTVTGFRRNRLHRLLNANLNVLAYHLPLDAHATLGNNIQLAQQLNLLNPQPLNPEAIVWTAEMPHHSSHLEAFIQQIKDRLQPSGGVTAITNQDIPLKPFKRIAWCTGGGGSYFETAIAAGVDVFLTGEANEQHVHIARESGVALVLAGHHATERYGIQALGNALSTQLNIETRYFDIDSPL